MISRRGIVVGSLVAGAFLSSPAFACRAPAPKDREGYTFSIDHLFRAWWARDFTAFQQPFQRPGREEPGVRNLFDAHFAERAHHFRGELLFNGASAVVQVITPQEEDAVRGICGGYVVADLFLVSFFPGLDKPVVDEVKHIGADFLAEDEWEGLLEPIEKRL